MDNNNILSIKNVSKSYKEFTLKDISFDVPRGTIIGLIGENGAGKTTLIKLILDLERKDSGTIELFGFDNTTIDRKYFNDIGVVFDDKVFPPELTSEQLNKIFYNLYDYWNEDKFFSLLENFKVSKSKKVSELSKGMYMKLAICVCLAHNPKLLILDEPTSGLDPVSRDELLDILMDFIQDENNSVILSSHITSDLDKIADYIAFIHEGQLAFFESKDELLYNYKLLKCNTADFEKIKKEHIIRYTKSENGYKVLINKQEVKDMYNDMVLDDVNVEDIMLMYAKGVK